MTPSHLHFHVNHFLRIMLAMLLVTSYLVQSLPSAQGAAFQDAPEQPTVAIEPIDANAQVNRDRAGPSVAASVAPQDSPDLVDRRTADSATYDLGDGRYAVVQNAAPMHYLDDHGQWQRIDPTFVAVENGWINRTNAVRTSIATTSSEAKISIGEAGVGWQPQNLALVDADRQDLALILPEQNASEGVLSADGRSVHYGNGWRDAAVEEQWETGNGQAEYTMRLAALPPVFEGHKPDQPAYLELRVALHLRPATVIKVEGKPLDTLDLPLETRQPIAFVSGAAEPLWLYPPAAYAEADPHDRLAGSYLLDATADPSVIMLRLRLDWEWFSTGGRQYPVVIDPVFQMRYPTTTRNQIRTFKNEFGGYVTSSMLEVGRFSNAISRSLIKFKLPTRVNLTTVDAAYLVVAPDGINFTNRDHLVSYLVLHELLNSDWENTSPPSDHPPIKPEEIAPANANSNLIGFARGDVDNGYPWASWNVTSQVQGWMYNDASNHGFLLKTPDTSEHCVPDPNHCGGFYIPTSVPGFPNDKDLQNFKQFFAGGAQQPMRASTGGVALVVFYHGPDLHEGEIFPKDDNPLINENYGNPTPSKGPYFDANHEYRIQVGNHWQAVVARGMGDRYGPENPAEGDPVGRNLKGSVPLELYDVTDSKLKPANDNDTNWSNNGHLSYVLFDGRHAAGSSYHIQVPAQADGEIPNTYDIRMVGEQPQTVDVGIDGSVELPIQPFATQNPLALWNIKLPPGSNSRVDVTITGFTNRGHASVFSLYDHARNFSAQLYRSDPQVPYFGKAALAVDVKSNAPAEGSLLYGNVSLSSPIFKPSGSGNYALALAYDGPQIRFYDPGPDPRSASTINKVLATPEPNDSLFDLVFFYKLRVTACSAADGKFPTSKGTCQTVRCPGPDFPNPVENRRVAGGLQLWSADGWNAPAGQPATSTASDVAPWIGGLGDVAPTVTVIGGQVTYDGESVSLQADSVALVKCGSLSNPAQPPLVFFDVYQGALIRSIEQGVAVLRRSGASGITKFDPWPKPDRDAKDLQSEDWRIEPSAGAVRGNVLLRRRIGEAGATILNFTTAYGATVDGWSSLWSAINLQSGTPPPIAGLSVALGEQFQLDTPPFTDPATPREFQRVRAPAATITQPANLGGASKPVQVVLLKIKDQIGVANGDNINCDGSCIDLRHPTLDRPPTIDTDGHPDRAWLMPDIHTNVHAGTVAFSSEGRLDVFSRDHPLAGDAVQDITQEFSFDTFGAAVSIGQGPCAGSQNVMIIEGSTHLTLPNIGSGSDPGSLISATFKLCETSPGAGDTTLRGVTLSFHSPVGIPVGGSGLFVTGLDGTVDIFPDYTQIKFGMDIQAAQGGNGGVFKGHGDVTIDTRGAFALQGGGTLLGVMNASGELFVAWNPMDVLYAINLDYGGWLSGFARVHMWEGQGWQNRYHWLPANDAKHMTAQFSATLHIEEGQAFSWWFIDIPPDDMSFTVAVAFGEFCTNANCSAYEWGVKGSFEVVGYTVGVYYGFSHGFDFILGNDGHLLIDQYGGGVAAAMTGDGAAYDRIPVRPPAPVINGAATEILTITPDTESLLVALGWEAGAPALALIDPTGHNVASERPADDPAPYTVAISATANSTLIGVKLSQPLAGQWQAVVSNLQGKEQYKLVHFANKGAPGFVDNPGRFLAPSSTEETATDLYTIRWEAPDSSVPISTTIDLLYTRSKWVCIPPKPPWPEVCAWMPDSPVDMPIVKNLPFNTLSYEWDTTGLASGRYALRAVVHDGVNDFPEAVSNPDNSCELRAELPSMRSVSASRFPGISTFTSPAMTIKDTTAPPTPTGLTLRGLDSALLARWEPLPDSEKGLAAYLVRWGEVFCFPLNQPCKWVGSYKEQRLSPAADPMMRLGGLNNDQSVFNSYGVTVSAIDASGNVSAPSALVVKRPKAEWTAQLPAKLVSLRAEVITSDSASFTWARNPFGIGAPPARYRLTYQRLGKDSPRASVETTDATVTVTGLQTGASYDVSVAPIDSEGWSGPYTDPVRIVVTNGVDSDGNGLPDDWEAVYGPFVSLPMVKADADRDGLSNSEEFKLGTDPKRQDTDGDGFSDWEEFKQETDALSALSYSAQWLQPRLKLLDSKLVFHAKVGDPNPPEQRIGFCNAGGGTLHLKPTTAASWLAPTMPTTGVLCSQMNDDLETRDPDYMRVAIDTTGLEAGFHTASLRIDPATVTIDPSADNGLIGGGSCIRVELWLSEDVDNVTAITGLTATNNGPTHLGNPTQLSATVTGGTNVTYEWDFGDNQTDSGATVNHTYAAVGTYMAKVTARNPVSQIEAESKVTVYEGELPYKIYLPLIMKAATALQAEVISSNEQEVDVYLPLIESVGGEQ